MYSTWLDVLGFYRTSRAIGLFTPASPQTREWHVVLQRYDGCVVTRWQEVFSSSTILRDTIIYTHSPSLTETSLCSVWRYVYPFTYRVHLSISSENTWCFLCGCFHRHVILGARFCVFCPQSALCFWDVFGLMSFLVCFSMGFLPFFCDRHSHACLLDTRVRELVHGAGL